MRFKRRLVKKIFEEKLLNDSLIKFSDDEKKQILEKDVNLMCDKFKYNIIGQKKEDNYEINPENKEKALKSYGEFYKWFFDKYMLVAKEKMLENGKEGKLDPNYLSNMMKKYNDSMESFFLVMYPDNTIKKEELFMPGINKQYVEDILYADIPDGKYTLAKREASNNVIGKPGESHKFCDDVTNSFNALKENNTKENVEKFLISYKLLQEKYHERNSFFYNWVPFRRGWTESRLLNNMRDEFMKLNGIKSKDDFNKLIDDQVYSREKAIKTIYKDIDLDKIMENVKKDSNNLEKTRDDIERSNKECQTENLKDHVKEMLLAVEPKPIVPNKISGERFVEETKSGKTIITDILNNKTYSVEEFKNEFKQVLDEIHSDIEKEEEARLEARAKKEEEMERQKEEDIKNGIEKDDEEYDVHSEYTVIEDIFEEDPTLTKEEKMFANEVEKDINFNIIEREFNKKLQKTLDSNNIDKEINYGEYEILNNGSIRKIEDNYTEVGEFKPSLSQRQNDYNDAKNDYYKAIKDYNSHMKACFEYFKNEDKKIHSVKFESKEYDEYKKMFEELSNDLVTESIGDAALEHTINKADKFVEQADKAANELNEKIIGGAAVSFKEFINNFKVMANDVKEDLNEIKKTQLAYKVNYYNKEDDVVDNDFPLESKEEYINHHINDEFVDDEKEIEYDNENEKEFENKEMTDEEMDKFLGDF